MNGANHDKDSPQIQKARIEQLVSEINLGLRVDFYCNLANPRTKNIRFKIYDRSTNEIIYSIPQDMEWASSEMADKSDAALRQELTLLIEIALAKRTFARDH